MDSNDVENCDYLVPLRSPAISSLYAVMNVLSSSLALVGYLSIIYIIFRGGWQPLSRLYNRLILAMSFFGVLNSVAMGFSYFPAPKNVPCGLGMGDMSTCTLQGFFIQLGLAVPGYTAMLSVYFLISIAYNVPEEVIKKFELFMHAAAVVPMISLGIFAAAEKLYNSQITHCWINEYCSESTCSEQRFENGSLVVWSSMAYGLLATTIIFTCTLILLWKLWWRAAEMRKSVRDESNQAEQPSKVEFAIRQSLKQALFYAFGYAMTYCWTFFAIVIGTDNMGWHIMIYLLSGTFLPSQGFWIFLVYIYPRFSKVRRDNGTISIFRAVLLVAVEDEDEDVEVTSESATSNVTFPLPSLDHQVKKNSNRNIV